MDNLWIIYGQSMDNIWEKCPICPSEHYARQVSEMLPTAVDASADSSEIWAAPIVTADLLTIPRHLRRSKNTGEGRFATWRETTIRYVEWWCLCICIYMINYIYIYIYIYMYSMRSIGKNLRCSQAGIFGKTPKKFCAPSRWPNSWPWNTHQAGPHQNPVLEILAEGAILRILWFHLQVINQLAALTVKKRGQFDCYWNVSLS